MGLIISLKGLANTSPKEGVAKLKEILLSLGQPKIEGTVQVGDELVPSLKFGGKAIFLNYKEVDAVKKLMGCTATIFVRHGEEFVRVSTHVLNADGTRAVGTKLARKAAYQAVIKDETFCGNVGILGSP